MFLKTKQSYGRYNMVRAGLRTQGDCAYYAGRHARATSGGSHYLQAARTPGRCHPARSAMPRSADKPLAQPGKRRLLIARSPHGQRRTCAQRRRPEHALLGHAANGPCLRRQPRLNDPTALGGIAGRFAGRFASADQPRGIRAAASVPGRGAAARARRAPTGPALGARAREFPAQPSSAHWHKSLRAVARWQCQRRSRWG